MLLPESERFGFGISDSPNINMVDLFRYLVAFPLRFKKRIKNYIEIIAENYIFVLNITNTGKNFSKSLELIWFIISIIDVYQCKKAVINM